MKKLIILSAMFLLVSMVLFASIDAQIKEIDRLITYDSYEEAKTLKRTMCLYCNPL